MSPVFEFPSYTIDSIKKHTFPRLTSFFHQHFITEASYLAIMQFLEKIILHDDIVIEKNYSKQLTRINHLWWSELFPDLPDFIPLDAESIVSEILIAHLHENTILTQMMTHANIQPYIEQYFNGISCCFDLVDHTGTYLFWYLDENNNRHALWREGDELVSTYNVFRIKMQHEEILYHLNQHHLIPSGLLIYTTLSCYYGVTCLGGFAQGNYLSKIQEAYSMLTVV